MAQFFPDLRSIFGEDELYKIFNISVLATPWEGTKICITEYLCTALICISLLEKQTTIKQVAHVGLKFQG